MKYYESLRRFREQIKYAEREIDGFYPLADERINPAKTAAG
ncbi:hypothetical protein [Paenibacillus rhizoplanae]|uniref:Uncharacterized protein n=1 Tax=Paenibacillus rhizoplanae TaxID=1917181 RepID=A0ABW5FH28_9BACL